MKTELYSKSVLMNNAAAAGRGVERARDSYNAVRRGDDVALIAERAELLAVSVARHEAALLELRNHLYTRTHTGE